MHVRGGFWVALGAVVVCIGAVLALVTWRNADSRRDLRSAQALAHRLDRPADGVASQACHGDGQVACWVTAGPARQVAQRYAASISAAGGRPSVRCDGLPVGVPPTTLRAESCQVIARFGSHVTAVFVSPQVRPVAGRPRIDGSLVAVSAA